MNEPLMQMPRDVPRTDDALAAVAAHMPAVSDSRPVDVSPLRERPAAPNQLDLIELPEGK